jgi:hypothetical protein
MYNFYQSELRKIINRDVYGRSIKECSINNVSYWAIIKHKKIWPRTLKRYQIQWVQRWNLLWKTDILSTIQQATQALCTSRSDFFVQFASIDIISSFDVKQIKFDDFCESMKALREQATQEFMKNSGTVCAVRENMPSTTIVINLWSWDEQLLEWMWQGCRQQIKKAISKEVSFGIAQEHERDVFYKLWSDVSADKGFHIPSKQQYDALWTYLRSSWRGNLFVTYHEWIIVSGSIVLFDHSHIIYLYGWSDRHAGNIGSHQFLMFEIMKRARDQWYEQFDLMGWAPTGYSQHPLASVSKFKEALGGTKLEYLWSFDLVRNKWLYRLFQRKVKH